jgi:hypothetical protein
MRKNETNCGLALLNIITTGAVKANLIVYKPIPVMIAPVAIALTANIDDISINMNGAKNIAKIAYLFSNISIQSLNLVIIFKDLTLRYAGLPILFHAISSTRMNNTTNNILKYLTILYIFQSL